MTPSTLEKDAITARISRIVEELMDSDRFYQEKLDRDETIDHVFSLVEQYLSPEELEAIDDNDLAGRIRKIMTTKAVAGMLDDFTPQQMEIFDAAVEGRW